MKDGSRLNKTSCAAGEQAPDKCTQKIVSIIFHIPQMASTKQNVFLLLFGHGADFPGIAVQWGEKRVWGQSGGE